SLSILNHKLLEGEYMMKNIIVFILITITFLMAIPTNETKQLRNGEDMFQVIPDEAIRLRILSHSDEAEDQQLKHLIRNKINEQITGWVEDFTSIEAAREVIQARLPEVKQIVDQVLAEEGNTYTASVRYENDISFPLKLYDSHIYPPGEYEAILVTLGEGNGSNWWCVLF